MSYLKTKKSAKEFCEGKSYVFAGILEYAYNIDFYAKPNYNEIKFLLKKVLLDLN